MRMPQDAHPRCARCAPAERTYMYVAHTLPPMMDPQRAYHELLRLMRNTSDLQSAVALLGWDQETYMPPAAATARAEQIATLSAMAHSILTSDSAQRLAEFFALSLPALDGELGDLEKRLARLFIRQVRQAVALPEDFVRRKAQITTLGQEQWKRARAKSSFALFRDDLAALVELARQEAQYRGYSQHPYDALLDLYEPGMTVQTLTSIFNRLAKETQQILDAVQSSGLKPDCRVLFAHYPAQKQLDAARTIIEAMGFDFAAGRVDLSAHPFCTSFATADVRLTTRINEHDLRSCLFGLIHEAGHGLYEQGMRPDLDRTLAREGASMGIHESQSLFWENIIARSEEFWQWAVPVLRTYFPSQLAEVTPALMYRAINVVEPSLIRIEADEVTYNMHIILRYRIEMQLLEGSITVDEVPEHWNFLMRELLGIEVSDDVNGCLQDIHWSFGGFGYFPSYTLGKLYAAMFRRALLEAMPEAPDLVRRGEFAPIRQWLKDSIHQWGRTRDPAELVSNVTGNGLSERDFVEYVWQKVQQIYGRE